MSPVVRPSPVGRPLARASGSVRVRHAGDAIRLGAGLVVVATASLLVQRTTLTVFERDLFRLVNDLPDALEAPLVVVMQGGNVTAAFVAAAVAIAFRMRRLAVDLLLAGPLAWFAAKGVKRIFERPRPGGLLDDVLRSEASLGLGFVSGHTAVACALATVASPYLPRRWRRIVWAGAWTVGLARVFMGAHLPLDIVGGAGLGWAVGAAVHVALGAPHRVPGVEVAERALERMGVTVDAIARVGGAPQGSFPFVAETPDGRVFVKLLDPDPRDRDLLYRFARLFAVRDARSEAALADAAAQAYHEAAMTMLAGAAGVRVPGVRRVQRIGQQVWLMEDAIDGRSLDVACGEDVPDGALVDAWRQVAALHAAGIAHRDLVAGNVLVDGGGRAWLVDLAHATNAPQLTAFDNDIAELLVATAALVGAPRAVDAALAVVGRDAVVAAAGELRPLRLTAVARAVLRERPDLVEELHAAVRRVAGGRPVDEPASPQPSWRTWSRRAVGCITAAALTVWIGLGAALDEVVSGSWRWGGLLVLVACVLPLARAIAIVSACGRGLAIGRTALAAAIADARGFLSGPDAADRALREHLGRVGLPAHEAGATARRVATLRRWSTGVLLAVALAAAAVEGVGAELSGRTRAATAAAIVATVVAASLSGAGGRRSTRHGRLDLRRSMWGALPAAAADVGLRAALVLVAVEVVSGGASTAAVLAAASMALVAGDIRALRVTVGARETVLLAGLLVAGVEASAALAVVGMSALLTWWVPAGVAIALRGRLTRRMVV